MFAPLTSCPQAVGRGGLSRNRETQQYQASARGIREWNEQVNERYAKVRTPPFPPMSPCRPTHNVTQTHDTKVITGVLYPITSSRARPIRLPCFSDPDDDARSTGLIDDVRVSSWFPHGSIHTRIHDVPGTTLTLQNDYTIVTCRPNRLAPRNQAVDASLDTQATGNVIVLRHHHRYRMSVTNVHSSERRLIDHVVRQYVVHVSPRLGCRAYLYPRFLTSPRASRRRAPARMR